MQERKCSAMTPDEIRALLEDVFTAEDAKGKAAEQSTAAAEAAAQAVSEAANKQAALDEAQGSLEAAVTALKTALDHVVSGKMAEEGRNRGTPQAPAARPQQPQRPQARSR